MPRKGNQAGVTDRSDAVHPSQQKPLDHRGFEGAGWQLFTVSEICSWLRVDRQTVRTWIREGRIPVIRLGSQKSPRYRFNPWEVAQYLKKNFPERKLPHERSEK